MSDFFVMPQYASLRGKLVLKTIIYIPALFVSSQTKRAYYMLKKRLQIVCEDTNEGSEIFKTSYVYPVEFANANIQQGLKLEHYKSDKRL